MGKLKIVIAVILVAIVVFIVSRKETSQTVYALKPVYIGQTNIVGAVEPTEGGTPWSLTSHGISETVYMLDSSGKLISRYVSTLEQIDKNNWKIVLNTGNFFSDGSFVDAPAVSKCMNTIMQENQLSNATAGKMVFTPVDNLTLTIKTERPTMLMQSVLTEWSNILFKQLENGEYVFSGPYVIKKLEPGVSIELSPNKYYPGWEKRSEVVIKAFKDSSALQLAFQSGELDMAFTITPDTAEMLSREGFIVKNINAGYQYFNIVNLKREPFNDLRVRQALNLSLNRDEMLKALRAGHKSTGFFAGYYSFAGKSQVEFDPEKADALLDSAGWKKSASGIRMKNGVPFKIKLTTYPTRPDLVLIMQIMVSQFKDRGIECSTELVDNIDAFAKKGDYDILVYAQHTAPTGDPAFALNQFFRADGAKNVNGYSSMRLDAILDKMGMMPQSHERDELAVTAQSVIFEDLPVFYLIDPQWHIAVSKRLKDYTPYGGDYYVVNDDLFAE